MVIVSMSTSSELMITMEVLIYSILGLMILLLVYGMFGRDSLTRRITHNINITTDDCASEDCVRCNKYEAVIERASGRYRAEQSLKTMVDNCSQHLSLAISCLGERKEYQPTSKQRLNILHIDGLTARPFWTDEDFVSDVAILESEMSAIVEKFDNVCSLTTPSCTQCITQMWRDRPELCFWWTCGTLSLQTQRETLLKTCSNIKRTLCSVPPAIRISLAIDP